MFRNKFDAWILFDADGSPQGGDSEDEKSPTQSFQRLLDRHNNDAMVLAHRLFDDNYQARQRIRELQGKLPGEGAIVLSAEEAQAWEAYKGLGTPDEVKQGLSQREELQGKLRGLERETQLRSAAEVAGYKPTVLARLESTARAEGKELNFLIKDIDQDGKKVRQAYVSNGESEQLLSDYAAKEWSDFLPALVVQPSTPSGQRFPVQHSGNSDSTASPLSVEDEFLQEREEKAKQVKNPLLTT